MPIGAVGPAVAVVAQLSPTRRYPARCVRPGGTLKRVHTEVPSGVAASNADGIRLPPPRNTLLSRTSPTGIRSAGGVGATHASATRALATSRYHRA